MKKLLYGTTALATAGLLIGAASQAQAQTAPHTTDRLSLKLGGYHQQWAVYNGSTNLRSGRAPANPGGNHPFDAAVVDEKHNSEVCFIGEVKLDSMITVGVNVQLEANTSGDQIDESYLYISSEDYGKLILGDENNAAYLLHVTAPDGGISANTGDLTGPPNQGLLILPGDFAIADTFIDGTYLRLNDNDSGKMTYISPRFAGFQIGLSYIPQYESGGDNNNSIQSINGDKGIAGTGNNGLSNGFAAGLNFKDQFGDLGVQASAGYQFGNVGANIGDNNLHGFSGGIRFAIGGVDFGGSFAWAEGDRTATTKFDSYGYDAGVAYSFGPYKVGVTYERGVADGNRVNGAKQYADYLILSGTYTLGPGIRLVGGVYGSDLDGENGQTTGTQVYKSSGIGAAVGLKLGF